MVLLNAIKTIRNNAFIVSKLKLNFIQNNNFSFESIEIS